MIDSNNCTNTYQQDILGFTLAGVSNTHRQHPSFCNNTTFQQQDEQGEADEHNLQQLWDWLVTINQLCTSLLCAPHTPPTPTILQISQLSKQCQSYLLKQSPLIYQIPIQLQLIPQPDSAQPKDIHPLIQENKQLKMEIDCLVEELAMKTTGGCIVNCIYEVPVEICLVENNGRGDLLPIQGSNVEIQSCQFFGDEDPKSPDRKNAIDETVKPLEQNNLQSQQSGQPFSTSICSLPVQGSSNQHMSSPLQISIPIPDQEPDERGLHEPMEHQNLESGREGGEGEVKKDEAEAEGKDQDEGEVESEHEGEAEGEGEGGSEGKGQGEGKGGRKLGLNLMVVDFVFVPSLDCREIGVSDCNNKMNDNKDNKHNLQKNNQNNPQHQRNKLQTIKAEIQQLLFSIEVDPSSKLPAHNKITQKLQPKTPDHDQLVLSNQHLQDCLQLCQHQPHKQPHEQPQQSYGEPEQPQYEIQTPQKQILVCPSPSRKHSNRSLIQPLSLCHMRNPSSRKYVAIQEKCSEQGQAKKTITMKNIKYKSCKTHRTRSEQEAIIIDFGDIVNGVRDYFRDHPNSIGDDNNHKQLFQNPSPHIPQTQLPQPPYETPDKKNNPSSPTPTQTIQNPDSLQNPITMMDVTPTILNLNLKDQSNHVYVIGCEESDSEGSCTNRQMKISLIRKEYSGKRDRNQEDTPYWFKSKQDMTEFYELQEKVTCLEEEKAVLLQRLEELHVRAQDIRKQAFLYDTRLLAMQSHYKQKLTCLFNQLTEYQQKFTILQTQQTQKSTTVQSLQSLSSTLTSTLSTTQSHLQILQSKHQSLQSHAVALEHTLEEQSKAHYKQISEKEQVIGELKEEIDLVRGENQRYCAQLQEELRNRDIRVDELVTQCDKYLTTIDGLKAQYRDVILALEAACHGRQQQGNMVLQGVYQGQFQKCTSQYQSQLMLKKQRIMQLEQQVSQLTKKIQRSDWVLDQAQRNLKQQEDKISAMKEEVSQRNKIQVSIDVEEELDYLRRELVSSGKAIDMKQSLIKKLYESIREADGRILEIQEELDRERACKIEDGKTNESRPEWEGRTVQSKVKSVGKDSVFQFDLGKLEARVTSSRNLLPICLPTSKSIFDRTINAMASTPSLPANPSQELLMEKQRCQYLEILLYEYEENMSQMQSLLDQYETILKSNQVTIKDLQLQVCEYMQDAVQKQRENEALYEDISSYEVELNRTLKDKISVQIENKRLKKMITASERRISAIGTRLIHATKEKDKVKKEQQYFSPISQNSTLKLRELRIE